MYLKSIEIQGFKSFPERTIIDFHEGMTAIVGPNGSGKSNVTDAIRWVLGEQSVKVLRGKKMEDMIFAGTSTRNPTGYAEVSIHFDNRLGKLPLDYQEVVFTRRLFRSGESEYLINKSPCRLKDLTDLLLDTGIGREGYSIIGQGRVDELLSPKSEDRRRVFEEAAGISKLRHKKEEASRKLEQTSLNLARVQDIVLELEQQVAPLAKQAERTAKYHELADNLEKNELTFLHRQIIHLQGQKEKLEQERQTVFKTKEEALAKIESAEIAYQEQLTSGHDFEQAQRQIYARLQDLQQEEVHQAAQIAARTARQQALAGQITQLEHVLQETNGQEEDLAQDLQNRIQKIADLKSLQVNLQTDLLNLQEKFQQKSQAGQENATTVQALEENVRQLQDRFYLTKADLADLQAKQNSWQSQREERMARFEQEKSAAALAFQEQEVLARKLEIHETHLTKTCEELLIVEEDLQTKRDEINRLEGEAEALKSEEKQLLYRRQVLQDLETGYSGYQGAVQALLNHKTGLPKKERQGVVGTVAELLHTERKYEVAVEVALGASVQHIVVDDDQTAGRLVQVLKQNHWGRATFLPLANLRPREALTKQLALIKHMRGFLGICADFVSVKKEHEILLSYLLGQIILVDKLDAAREIAAKLDFKVRVITLEGEIFAPGGAITGGSLQEKRPKLLARTRELDEIKDKLSALPEERAVLEDKVAGLQQEFLRLGRRLASLQEEKHLAEIDQVRLEGAAQELKRQILIWQESSADFTARLKQEEEQVLLWAEQEKKAEADLHLIQASLQAEDFKSKNLAAEKIALSHQLNTLRQELEEKRLSLQANEQMQKTEEEWLDLLKKDLQNFKQKYLTSIDELKRLQEEASELVTCQEKDESARMQLQTSLQAERASLQKLQEDNKELEQNKEAILAKLRQLNDERSLLDQDSARMEGRLERLTAQESDLRQRLWEEFNQIFENIPATALLPEEEISTAKLQQLINAYKADIQKLGPINPQAISEYEQVKQRYDFLLNQRRDIATAQEDLQKLIRQLETNMKGRFKETFAQINENFNQVFGALFGGGRAEVSLSEGEDILTSTIEIRALPPGKRLQNMLLLSGGERSLTAIALLFAILSLRSTPFVILDEIEATLDDANVLRFAEYVRDHSANSQFILVTHRKGTMETCDRIYGVTMQERGVSKVLSMQLTSAQKLLDQ